MTGDEHYREAERLVTESVNWKHCLDPVVDQVYIQAAQVHATLALAAATLDAAFVVVPYDNIGRTQPQSTVGDARKGEGYGR